MGQEAKVATACLLSQLCVEAAGSPGSLAVVPNCGFCVPESRPVPSGGLLSTALVPGGGVMGAAGRNAAHVVFRDLKNM